MFDKAIKILTQKGFKEMCPSRYIRSYTDGTFVVNMYYRSGRVTSHKVQH